MSSALSSGMTTVHADKHTFTHQTIVNSASPEDLFSYKPACFHVCRGQIGLETLSQLSRGSFKCVYVGNSI
jgi:hypothetical protein